MLFAQREVFVSYSERDLHQIQQALNQDAAIEYRILADKKDEALARHMIGRCCVGKGTQQ